MDQYKVIKFVNQGSFGKIYSVQRIDSKQIFAMKTIRLTGIDRYQRVCIITELKILLTNKCNILLKCYDLFIHNNRLCIITEYVDGSDLDRYIKSNKKLDSEVISKIFFNICVGINSLHLNKIIHRDIKPSNVLISKSGDIKICDFGICKYLEYNKITSTVVGTPYFMSPEQINHRHYDYKSDVWSIGCILYTLLYNKYPFTGASMSELKRNIRIKNPFIASPSSHTQQFIAIMRDMLDKNKFKRPELNTFLTNKSNQKLINYHKITNNFETFHKYNILSVPSSPKEWNELVIKLRNDFNLPKSLFNRTEELLKETRLPNNLPNITSYSTIKRESDKLPHIKPAIPKQQYNLPKIRISEITSQYKRNHNHQNTPKHNQKNNSIPIQSDAKILPTKRYVTPDPIISPRVELQPSESPTIERKYNNDGSLKKYKSLLNYLRNKAYSPPNLANKKQHWKNIEVPRPNRIVYDDLPPVKNRYKHIQSKVKKYWT